MRLQELLEIKEQMRLLEQRLDQALAEESKAQQAGQTHIDSPPISEVLARGDPSECSKADGGPSFNSGQVFESGPGGVEGTSADLGTGPGQQEMKNQEGRPPGFMAGANSFVNPDGQSEFLSDVDKHHFDSGGGPSVFEGFSFEGRGDPVNSSDFQKPPTPSEFNDPGEAGDLSDGLSGGPWSRPTQNSAKSAEFQRNSSKPVAQNMYSRQSGWIPPQGGNGNATYSNGYTNKYSARSPDKKQTNTNSRRITEADVGKIVMSLLASVLVFLGLGTLTVVVYSQLSDLVKVVFTFVLSGLLLGVGKLLSTKRDSTVARALMGCGTGALYISFAVQEFLLDVGLAPTGIGMLLVGILAFYLSTQHKSGMLLVLAYIGMTFPVVLIVQQTVLQVFCGLELASITLLVLQRSERYCKWAKYVVATFYCLGAGLLIASWQSIYPASKSLISFTAYLNTATLISLILAGIAVLFWYLRKPVAPSLNSASKDTSQCTVEVGAGSGESTRYRLFDMLGGLHWIKALGGLQVMVPAVFGALAVLTAVMYAVAYAQGDLGALTGFCIWVSVVGIGAVISVLFYMVARYFVTKNPVSSVVSIAAFWFIASISVSQVTSFSGMSSTFINFSTIRAIAQLFVAMLVVALLDVSDCRHKSKVVYFIAFTLSLVVQLDLIFNRIVDVEDFGLILAVFILTVYALYSCLRWDKYSLAVCMVCSMIAVSMCPEYSSELVRVISVASVVGLLLVLGRLVSEMYSPSTKLVYWIASTWGLTWIGASLGGLVESLIVMLTQSGNSAGAHFMIEEFHVPAGYIGTSFGIYVVLCAWFYFTRYSGFLGAWKSWDSVFQFNPHVEPDSKVLNWASVWVAYVAGMSCLMFSFDWLVSELPLVKFLLVMLGSAISLIGLKRSLLIDTTRTSGLLIGLRVTSIVCVALWSFIGDVASPVISIACIALAIACILIGFKYRVRSLRQYGLGLSIAGVLKLILIDLDYNSSLSRVIWLILGGLMCFAIVAIYSKVSSDTQEP